MSTSKTQADDAALSIFKPPPVPRSTTLDRSRFAKTVRLAAALVRDKRSIAAYRKSLIASGEMLRLSSLDSVRQDSAGRKSLLLRPGVKPGEPETWSATLSKAVEAGDLSIESYELNLDYSFWSYLDIMKALLPVDLQDEIPVGFNVAGHVAHFNLREPYLPFKHLIAEVVLSKNPAVRTVINKIDKVGHDSRFRTFPFEVLAGPADLNVEVSENGCVFGFDYGRVYWNSKLSLEHRRLLDRYFKPGEVVCDAMAGVGPFALPAGKAGVFVMANDLNPHSYEALTNCIRRNKVSQFVKPFNMDGGDFIHQSGEMVLAASCRGDHALVGSPKVSRRGQTREKTQSASSSAHLSHPQPKRVPLPPTVSHYVMNLPDSAITFLHHFRGVYRGREQLFAPDPDGGGSGDGNGPRLLPLVHVYCFVAERGEGDPAASIRQRIRDEIGVLLDQGDDGTVEGQVTIEDVRDVAPNKRMFCATFRLPRVVAFGEATNPKASGVGGS